MNDPLSLYRTFLRVVETGAFSRVAEETGQSQPTISRQIAALEARLGVRLLQRSTRTQTLTSEGEVFLEQARHALEAVARAEESVGRGEREAVGLLRLAVPVVFGRMHVIGRLSRFMQRHPKVAIDLVMNDGVSDLVGEGIDLALRIGEVTDQTVVARRIGVTRRVAVAASEYLERRGMPDAPEDLAGHDCIAYTRLAAGPLWEFNGPGGPVSVRIGGPVRVNNSEGVREAMLAGLGIALLPTWHLADGLEAWQVMRVLPRHWGKPLPMHLIYPSRRFLPAKTRVMIDFLTEEFRSSPLFGPEEGNPSMPTGGMP